MERSYQHWHREAWITLPRGKPVKDHSLIRNDNAHAILEDYERDLAKLVAEYAYRLTKGSDD